MLRVPNGTREKGAGGELVLPRMAVDGGSCIKYLVSIRANEL
jgi:hypothetical protein